MYNTFQNARYIHYICLNIYFNQMGLTFRINDISKPEAKAFLDYARSLKFVIVDEEEVSLNQEQIEGINEARISLKKNGGKSHEDVISEMKSKYPNAFGA